LADVVLLSGGIDSLVCAEMARAGGRLAGCEDVPFDCAQYATRADAEAGHALIVARVRGLPHPLRGRR